MQPWTALCVFLLIFLIHSASPQTCLCARGFCEAGWVQYMNACYKAERERKTWTDAEMACHRYGWNAHLASIHSAEENDFLFHLMGKPLDYTEETVYWIGAHDTFKEGTFVWTDGSQFDFQSYPPNQPDGSPDEHYLGSWFFQNGHITWNDFLNDKKFSFVCKYYLGNGMCCASKGPGQR